MSSTIAPSASSNAPSGDHDISSGDPDISDAVVLSFFRDTLFSFAHNHTFASILRVSKSSSYAKLT
jgi:hypothetical protein